MFIAWNFPKESEESEGAGSLPHSPISCFLTLHCGNEHFSTSGLTCGSSVDSHFSQLQKCLT